jgi:hypothetical protein
VRAYAHAKALAVPPAHSSTMGKPQQKSPWSNVRNLRGRAQPKP